MTVSPSDLWQAFTRLLEADPAAPAVVAVETERVWSRGELGSLACEYAAIVAPAARQIVAWQGDNSPDWLARFLALQAIGAASLSLDAALPESALEETAASLGATFLWHADGLLSHVDTAAFAPLDDSSPEGIPLRPEANATPGVAVIKTTSGSTGIPQAVPCHASHLIADGENVIATMGLLPGDRHLAAIPLGHSYGLGNLVMPLLLQGAVLVTARTYLPRQLVRWMETHRVTVFPGVPSLFRLLSQLTGDDIVSTLRLAISAGAPLQPEVARDFHERFGVRIHNFYGSSETGGICYDHTGGETLVPGAVGRPLEGVTIGLTDEGRVAVTSRAVAVGEETAEASPQRTFLLADYARWAASGDLIITGRASAWANIGGKKVDPREVEFVLRQVPEVHDAWVTVRQDARGNDYLAAALETALTRAEIERQTTATLPAWKLPRLYHLALALPRNARGKLDRVELEKEIAKLAG